LKAPSTIEQEVLLALYRYTMLTTKQLSAVCHYHPRNVQIALRTLRQEHWADPMQLSFLERNVKGWVLSKSGLEMAFGLTKEQRPGLLRRAGQSLTQVEHLYGTNYFFSSLIAESLVRPESEGLIEWIGMRDSGERYAVTDGKGKRRMPVRPDGIGTYRFTNGTSTVFHVEYDTGSERLWIIQDKLTLYAEHLSKFWRNPTWTSVLFITQDEHRASRILHVWKELQTKSLKGMPVPEVRVASVSQLQHHGPLGRVWADTNASRASLAELPRIRNSGDDGASVLGKQPRASSFPPRKRDL